MILFFMIYQCIPLYFFFDFTRIAAAPAPETVSAMTQKKILLSSPDPTALRAGIFSVSFSPQTEQTRSYLPLR